MKYTPRALCILLYRSPLAEGRELKYALDETDDFRAFGRPSRRGVN